MARARLELLARIGELNELELDPDTRLDALLDSMLPEIADACAIFLIEQNELRLVGADASGRPTRSRRRAERCSRRADERTA